ncbi:MAG: 4Fe-4S binding protein [Muribaculaceae bacterium]|nr:4Fe-4S binding protein [Muribaculaceae bacterium]
MNGKALRYVRIVVQTAVILLLTALLLATPTAAVAAPGAALKGWMLFPLAFGGMLLVVAFWAGVTLLFGRVYCSTMCPVGTLQDLSARFRRLVWPSSWYPYRYSPPAPLSVRAAMIVMLIMSAALGAAATGWALMPFIQVSPTDSYEHIVYAVTPHEHHLGARLIAAAGVNLVFIVGMGMWRGRELCNKLCPLGAGMGALSPLALMQIDIDTDRCTHCRRCEDVCKAGCLDSEISTIDAQRCVRCFDCLAACHDDAIRFTTRRHRLSIPMLQKIEKPAAAMVKPEEPAMNEMKKVSNRIS